MSKALAELLLLLGTSTSQRPGALAAEGRPWLACSGAGHERQRQQQREGANPPTLSTHW